MASRNEMLEAYRTYEAKSEELAAERKKVGIGNFYRGLAAASSLGFGSAAAYFNDGNVDFSTAALGLSGILMGAYVFDFTITIMNNKRNISALEDEISELMELPAYQKLLEEY